MRIKTILAATLLGAAASSVAVASPAWADYCGDAVCVYDNSTANGAVEGFNVADSNLNNGNHFSNGVPTNDHISSVDIWGGKSVRFYTDSFFRGNSEDWSYASTPRAVIYNNQISSFRYLI